MSKIIILYCDGGSRGNPGPAAAGFVGTDSQGRELFSGGQFLGVATNNVAEYTALELGLLRAAKLRAEQVWCRLDSELVVKQMKGEYKIKHPDLKLVAERVRQLLGKFEKVSFTHIPREKNSAADAEVNKVLDRETKSPKFSL